MNSSVDHNTDLRMASNKDSDRIILLIDSVLSEWDDAVCLENSEKDLLDIESTYLSKNGAFVVLERDSKIVGTHAVLPVDESQRTCTFKRLYLDKTLRGSSCGTRLMNWAIDWAVKSQFKKIEFWSDSRFDRAHHFFEKFQFKKGDQCREMHDSFQVYHEFYFSREL